MSRSDLITKFNLNLVELIKKTDKYVNTAKEIEHMSRIKRLMRLCPVEEKFMKAMPVFINLAPDILKKDINRIAEHDYKQYMRDPNSNEDNNILEELLIIIQKKYDNLDDSTREEYWKIIISMLQSILQYKKLELA
jgi:hypothetical protein